MATLLEILGGAPTQTPRPTLDLSATPAQKGFNPDEQRIREFILGLGGEIAADQSRAFLDGQGQAQSATPFPNALTPEQAIALGDPVVKTPLEGVQLPPQTEQGGIASLLGFPGAAESNLLEQVRPVLQNVFEGGGEQPAPEPAQQNIPEQAETEALLGARLDDITTGKIDFNPTDIIEPVQEGIGQASADEVNSILQGAAPEEVMQKAEASFLDRPGMRDLLLGVGISLLQGKGIGDAMANGVAMMKQAQSSEAKARQQGALQDAELGLVKAQTRKANAEATKIGSAAGLQGDELKGFRQAFKTVVGEQGIGDDVAIQRAQAQAANQELAARPDSAALKKIKDDSVTAILQNIDQLDIEDAREELERLRNEFGADYVNELAQQITGG
jgi:hypothetical protein